MFMLEEVIHGFRGAILVLQVSADRNLKDPLQISVRQRHSDALYKT